MTRELDRLVRGRAGHRCEYCRLPQATIGHRFWIDHVVARQHGGTDDPANLALSCAFCNLTKGPNLASIDPLTGTRQWLFDPRRDVWDEHFAWQSGTASIMGLTPRGRATVRCLDVNRQDNLRVREVTRESGLL